MAITQTIVAPHWSYLLAIEDDVERLSRYVEFTEANYPSFSIEIARLLMAAAAEVDIVCKQICKDINPTSEARNIEDYRKEICPHYPRLAEFKVLMTRYGLTLEPWKNWQSDQVPDWWTGNNKVKHHRHTNYEDANLKNALNAFAGLFVVTMYLYLDKVQSATLRPVPKLLSGDPRFTFGTDHNGPGFGLYYQLV